MVGSVGQLRSIPRPGPSAIREVFDLLTAVKGGTKTVKSLLEKMLKVQEENAEVLAQAQKAVAERDKLEAEIAAKRENLQREYEVAEADLAARIKELDNREESLNNRDTEVQALAKVSTEKLDKKKNEDRKELAEVRKTLADYRERLETKEAEQDKREQMLDALQTTVRNEKEENEKTLKLLQQHRRSLEGYKQRLDERDKRLRIAMGEEVE